MRKRYTADAVQVTDWVDAGTEEPVSKTIAIPAARYNGFTLGFTNGAFYHLDAEGKAWGNAVVPKIEPAGTGFRVRYIVGMSEGNSWLFARRGDCWELVADPEPSFE